MLLMLMLLLRSWLLGLMQPDAAGAADATAYAA